MNPKKNQTTFLQPSGLLPFSEVGSIEQLNSVYVGRTYSVNFAPFCLSDTELMKIINGSVEKLPTT